MKILLSSILALFAAAVTFGQGLFGNDTQAFVLMPAQTIASAHTFDVQISPSGRLIVYRQVPVGTPESVLANPRQGKGQWYVYDRVAKTNRPINLPDKVDFSILISDEQSIYFETSGPETAKGFLNIKSGTIVQIETLDARIIYFGSSEYAKCLIGLSKDNTLVSFLPNGSVRTAPVEPKVKIIGILGGDATSLYFLGRLPNKPPKNIKVTLNRSKFLLTYGDFRDMELETFRSSTEPTGPVFVARPSGDMNYVSIYEEPDMPTTSTSDSSRLDKQDKKLASTSVIPKSTRLGPAGDAEFSQRYDFVIYEDAGALLLREIKPIDKLLAEKLATDEIKKKLLSKAKQVGTAFAIYASDYDDVLPGQEGWENKLMPYTKNRELLNDFNYSFRGGDMNLITDPANTELGFVLGPGGRAVVYIDGHAKWIPNP